MLCYNDNGIVIMLEQKEMLMQNPVEELNYLGEIIDHYVTEDRSENQGPFHFLREDMVIRALSGTATGRASVTGLKTYLAKEILKINEGGSYVTYRNILENLSGVAKKKYKTDTHDLEMCFDWEGNRETILQESENFRLPWKSFPEQLKGEKIPWILLRLLQEDAEWHLLKIWELQDTYFDREDSVRLLQEEYMKVLHTMALQEIFYKEFLVLPAKRNLSNLAGQTDSVQKIADTLEKYAFAIQQAMGDDREAKEIRQLAEKVRDTEKELRDAVWDIRKTMHMQNPDGIQPGETGCPEDIQRLVQRQHLYMVLEIEQNLDLAVEFQILTMFEAMNIKGRGCRAGETLKDWMYEDGKKIWEVFERNPNRSAIYREMDAYAGEMLVDYWIRKQGKDKRKGYRDFVEALDAYFEQLHWKFEDGRKYNEERMKEAKETIAESNREYWKSGENRNGDKCEEE